MRKIFLIAALTGTALTMTACSQQTEDVVDPAAEETVAGTETDAAMADAGTVLNANDVTAEQLAAMDGMSPELAAAIVVGQPYDSVADFNDTLMESVSAAEAATIRERVFMPVDLNNATREDIALIPGMTDRMIGEFLEYRPYADMAEFDREIGKYVDETEVARFRNYVTL